MENQTITSGNFFKALKLIYFAMLIMQIVLAFITILALSMTHFETDGADLRNVFIYIVPLFVLTGFLASNIVFKNRLKAIDANSRLIIKLTEYRSALIIRYALVEGISLFAIIVFLVTGDLIFMMFGFITILYFLTLIPNVEKAIRDLELDSKDRFILSDPEKEI